MSDERTITLTVLASQKDRALEILFPYVGEPNDENDFIVQADPALYYMQYYEIKATHFATPLAELQAAGIAWDYQYGRSDDGDSQSGEDHLRFTETGENVLVGWMEEATRIPVYVLMGFIEFPDKLIEKIRDVNSKLTPLPWTNQEEYGKRYQAAQLLLQGAEQHSLV